MRQASIIDFRMKAPPRNSPVLALFNYQKLAGRSSSLTSLAHPAGRELPKLAAQTAEDRLGVAASFAQQLLRVGDTLAGVAFLVASVLRRPDGLRRVRHRGVEGLELPGDFRERRDLGNKIHHQP